MNKQGTGKGVAWVKGTSAAREQAQLLTKLKNF